MSEKISLDSSDIIRINHFEYTDLYLYIRLLSHNDVLV